MPHFIKKRTTTIVNAEGEEALLVSAYEDSELIDILERSPSKVFEVTESHAEHVLRRQHHYQEVPQHVIDYIYQPDELATPDSGATVRDVPADARVPEGEGKRTDEGGGDEQAGRQAEETGTVSSIDGSGVGGSGRSASESGIVGSRETASSGTGGSATPAPGAGAGGRGVTRGTASKHSSRNAGRRTQER